LTDTIDVEIEALSLNGDGVAHMGRRLVNVPFTIPGERVRAHIHATRGDVISASLVDVLRASPHRVDPRCRHFGPAAEGGRTCGGCAWQHIAYQQQLIFKTELVTRLVREKVPSAPAARTMLPSTSADAPWHYRHKAHFVVERRSAGTLTMGHYARLSRRIIPVRECPVHDERGNSVAFMLRDACERADARAVKSIAVRAGFTRPETMATIVVASDEDKRTRVATRRALAMSDAPTSLHVNVHPRGDAFIFGRETRHIAGPERLREDIGGASFLISPTSFFQTNVRAAEILVQHVLGAVQAGTSVLDLYAGAGLFALPLALRGYNVVAIEENRSAVADGQASMRLSRVPQARCRFIAKPVDAALRSNALMTQRFDVVILDPPRQGCEASVVDRLLARGGPKKLVYVSCDPESLSRDLARIIRYRYVIDSMQPVDMFPHTPHIETVVVLSRTE
jgi:23S rRNA (uracil1939-C5)-methyltransferase